VSDYCEQLISENDELRVKLIQSKHESQLMRKEFEESQAKLWQSELKCNKLSAQLQSVQQTSAASTESNSATGDIVHVSQNVDEVNSLLNVFFDSW